MTSERWFVTYEYNTATVKLLLAPSPPTAFPEPTTDGGRSLGNVVVAAWHDDKW